MPAGGLYKGERVFDEGNVHELCGDGSSVVVGGERRLLSRVPPPRGIAYAATPFAASGITKIPRSDWSAMLREQAERKQRVSDYCDFPAFDQDGLPTCWAICTAQCLTTQRRIQGLPFVQLSGCSLAVPISGGHVGGYEGDSLELSVNQGVASTKYWAENNTARRLINDPDVMADRANHKALSWLNCGDDADVWGTMGLLTKVGAFAYDWMSHCMMFCDLVEIEANSFGFRMRNSWRNDWGAKNDLGFGGFNVWREGRRGTPNSGYVVSQITAATN